MPVVGDLKIVITATTESLKKNLKEASSLIRDWSILSTGLTAGVTTAFQKLASVGIKAVKVALGTLAVGFAVTAKRGADFQDSLVRAFAILRKNTEATEESFEALRLKARQLGSDTLFTATEAAKGMKLLAQAGLDTEGIMANIGSAIDLAVVGSLELSEATKAIVRVSSQFGISIKNSSQVADKLTIASTKSTASIEELINAFSFVGATSRATGTSLDDTATALAILADNGIVGSKAGTSLAQAMQELIAPTGAAKEIFNRLGLTFTDSRGKMIPFTKALKKIERAGLTAGEVFRAFGKRGGRAIELITKAGSSKFAKLKRAIKGSEGAAEEFSQTFRTTVTGRVKDLLASLDNLGGAFSDEFNKPLANSIFALRNFIKDITEAGTKGGVFKAIVEGMGTAFKPISDLLKELGDKAIAFIKNLTPEEIGQFFDKVQEKINNFITSLTSGEIGEVLGRSFDIVNKGVSLFITSIKVALGLWNMMPDAIKPSVTAMGLVTAGAVNLVGGLTNIIFQVIAIGALVKSSGAGFVFMGAIITTKIIPALKTGALLIASWAKTLLAIAALSLVAISLVRYITQLKVVKALVDDITAAWRETIAQASKAGAEFRLFQRSFLKKDTTKAAEEVRKAQAEATKAGESRVGTKAALGTALATDKEEASKLLNPFAKGNVFETTMGELKELLKIGIQNEKGDSLTNTLSKQADISAANFRRSSEASKEVLKVNGITQDIDNTKKSQVDVGKTSLEEFRAITSKIGMENIASVEKSSDNLKNTVIKTKDGMTLLAEVYAQGNRDVQAEVEALNILIVNLSKQAIKPSEDKDKKSSANSGMK